MSHKPVVFEERPSASNKSIAVATLNSEKTLNALTLEMVELLTEQFLKWQVDDSIACVFIQGAGSKALCAGGDIQQLYRSAIDKPGGPCEYAEAFVTQEYRLDYLLHTYNKPIVCWGHGIVMGGGLGILAGCSHRVVTEKTRMAMPEVSIGLFPDVGGSWFLNRMPDGVGLFLALTAAQMNASDCIYTGIADCFIESAYKDALLTDLIAIDWSPNGGLHGEQISAVLNGLEARSHSAKPVGNVAEHLPLIQFMSYQNSLASTVDAIINCQSDDVWIRTASTALKQGSPLSACVIHQTLERTLYMNLAEVFQYELVLATNMFRCPEFAEGVRALLIDKDKSPRWLYQSVKDVPAVLLEKLVTPPWPTNPLADL